MSGNTNKTVPTTVGVDDFLAALPRQQQEESRQLIAIMQEVTGETPVMWGPSIIGFGSYHYKYESGREGDAPAVSFAPRKANLVIYLADGVSRHEALLERIGPHTTSKVCVYIKRLSAIDLDALRDVIAASYGYVTTQLAMHRAE